MPEALLQVPAGPDLCTSVVVACSVVVATRGPAFTYIRGGCWLAVMVTLLRRRNASCRASGRVYLSERYTASDRRQHGVGRGPGIWVLLPTILCGRT